MFKTTQHLIIAGIVGGLILATGKGMAGEAPFKDTLGGDAIKAFDTMTSRGFEGVDTYTTPDGVIVTWWFNPKTGQCVNTQSENSKVIYAEAGKYPKCDEAAKQSGGNDQASGPSNSAKQACMAKFGRHSTVKMVSPLKPGWWEIILVGNKGRQVACTVNDSGKIDDWVEM